jgi:DMSO reductase anchor subunit
MRDFLIIFASIIILITLLRQIFYPQMVFDLNSIYTIMAFSIISALLGFILYTPDDISETRMRLKIVVHFFTLELLLIALGSIFDIVNNVIDVIILALQIAVIYFIVRLLSWRNDKKEAQRINEKLMSMKKDVHEPSIKS